MMDSKIFEIIKDVVNSYLLELDQVVVIESEVIYGNNKIEYALSSDEYMASISILQNLTYDFFVLDIESETAIVSKTEQFKEIDELFCDLKVDIASFANFKK
ncbi:hypothetical protein [Paenibacillus nasutitermitis]|uniref:Uncharacterized protein n=1 Tax=Paenibacillus nasutitermitis TaxID=1652958 RepID=A0A916Z6K1_9BACL|nr:hypothetical protein [Paenibacillus nasutitermitis]GGD79008.1 hypothetical protein GCM10010911_41360 [Paenibacillus nasutitermitis]